MGTSKGYLPPQKQGSPWHSLNIQLGKLHNNPERINLVLSKFIKSIGGAKAFSSSNSSSSGGGTFKSSAARKTAQKLGSFFSDAHRVGFKEALKSRSIEFEGKTLGEIKEVLIDYFIETSIDADTYAASKAISNIMDELFEGIESEEKLEDYFTHLITSENKKIIMCGFYENYICELFARIIFEKRSEHSGLDDASEILENARDTISAKVQKFQCNHKLEEIDFNGESGKNFVQGILNEVLEIMEDDINV